MNSEPKYCPKCGGVLVDVSYHVSGWSKIVACQQKGCGQRWEIVYGDMMGGAPYCSINEVYSIPIQKDT